MHATPYRAFATGETSTSQALSEVNDQMSSDWLTPEHSEFAGPYLSLLMAVSGHSESLNGATYYESLLTVLPRFMYPGQKPELLTHEFDRQMHRGGGAIRAGAITLWQKPTLILALRASHSCLFCGLFTFLP